MGMIKQPEYTLYGRLVQNILKYSSGPLLIASKLPIFSKSDVL